MSERYKNPCGRCASIGQWNEWDLYYCHDGGGPLALNGTSCEFEQEQGTDWTLNEGDGAAHPALREAYRRYYQIKDRQQ